MIWGALIEMKDKQNATQFTEILDNNRLPFIQFHEQDSHFSTG